VEEQGNRESQPMWISLFTIVSGIAICLCMAAVIMQASGENSHG
jgi:hypothetical protein